MPVERRRYLRHKVHSPAYASIGAGVGGVVLDANERGVAVESVSHLTPQSIVDLRLDLLDTRSSAVTPARVAWCDGLRLAGLEFLNLTGESRRQLQQWLLLNALLAAENAGRLTQVLPEPPPQPPSRTEATGEPALLALAQRALACTHADGAALALAEGEDIVCRATAGEIAPPFGTRLDAQAGISGACVRSGRWLRCDDPRLDPHVDRESCRALGINSVMAVPVGERGDILGLIEVFARTPYAFNEEHCSALQELARALARSLRPQALVAPSASAQPQPLQPAPTAQVVPNLPDAQGAAPVPALNVPAPAAAVPAIVPAPAVIPLGYAAQAPGPVMDTTAEQPASSAAGERVVIFALLAVLVVLGLWFVLGRAAGGAKNVDAAEPPPSATRPQPSAQRTPPAAARSAPVQLPDSLRELRRRAEAGEAEAAFELGARYASGEDLPQDYAQAAQWFTRAANGGQVLAAATLGAYYWAGRGVDQDDVSAYMWSAIAREGGDEASKYRLAILRSRMTAAQLAQAEQRAAAWQRAHSHLRLAGKSSNLP